MAKRRKDSASARADQARKSAEKELRKKAAQLKRKGIAFGGVNLRPPKKMTRHIRETVRDFEGVLSGAEKAVKIGQPTRMRYKGTGVKIAPSGKYAVVKNEPDAIHTVKRGMLATIRPLGNGYVMETITLPVNLKSVRQLRKWIESGEPDRLKHPNEYFGFRLQGHMSHTAVPNSSALHDYMMRYNFYGKDYDLDTDDPGEGDEPISIELIRVYPPDEWDKARMLEDATYKSSPEYASLLQDRKERRNLARSIRDRRARKQKKPAPGFATLEQIKNYTRGEKLRSKDRKRSKVQKAKAKSDPAFAEKLRAKRRAKEKRQRAKGSRK